jgi:hypothetical protein
MDHRIFGASPLENCIERFSSAILAAAAITKKGDLGIRKIDESKIIYLGDNKNWDNTRTTTARRITSSRRPDCSLNVFLSYPALTLMVAPVLV